jgi:pimeloyl-ACP methyl ester carboxylesterase
MQNTAAVEATTRATSGRKAASNISFPKTVVSQDGTSIAFERAGSGPLVILIDGALCHRRMGQSRELAALLSPHFSVITYDRRGRGDSGDTPPYAVEREVEDIAALVREAGGSACLWGMSSGALLALEAASRVEGIRRVALYEAPLVVDGSRPATTEQWARIDDALAADRRGVAVRLFLQGVGMPGILISLMRLTPAWPKLKAVAHTLPYDGAIVGAYQQGQPLPAGQWAFVKVPTLVMDGGKSAEWMRRGNRALSLALPNADYRTLDGQTHMLKPKAHAPTLIEFFRDGG